MKRVVLSLLLLLSLSCAFSQRLYFIYLQSDPQQSFFVKMGEKVHSSSSSGYLILARLADSSYELNIGFPGNKWPEQKFTVDIAAKDRGYVLKNFGAKGWGLYDIETSTTKMGVPANGNLPRTEPKEVSMFTEILSKAANDPSLKERPVEIKEEKQQVIAMKDPVQPSEPPPVTAKQDSPLVTIKEDKPDLDKKEETLIKTEEPAIVGVDSVIKSVDSVVKKESVKSAPTEEYKRSVVTKKSESSLSEGMGLTFVDDYGNGKKDTIRILIPNPKKQAVEVKEQPKEEKKFLEISSTDSANAKLDSNKNDIKPVQTESLPVPVSPKNNCTSTAVESDFLKLRKKMAAVEGNDNMVAEAKKYFRTKCFSTAQIKNLSSLFLDDFGKYKFFDAAYEHVSDIDNFPSLSNEMKDVYYINRFKAMLR